VGIGALVKGWRAARAIKIENLPYQSGTVARHRWSHVMPVAIAPA
jgi:hypothetical protein